MYCWVGVQPVPPHSLGQCGTAQPLSLRIRCQRTMSSFERWRPSTILRRISGGSAARKKARTWLRNAISSDVKRRSMAQPPLLAREALAAFGDPREQRRRLPELAVLAVELAHGVVDPAGADGVRVIHRPAAPAREAEAVEPHHVDVARAQRDAFVEDLGALVDAGI